MQISKSAEIFEIERAVSRWLKVEALQRSFTAGVVFCLLSLFYFYFGLSNEVIDFPMIIFSICIFVTSIFRMALPIYFRRNEKKIDSIIKIWRISVIINALSWGGLFFSVTLHYDTSSLMFTSVFMTFSGILAGSMTSLVSEPKVHKILLLSTSFPLIVALAMKTHNDDGVSTFPISLLIFISTLFFFLQSKKIFLILKDSHQRKVELEFEKSALAKALVDLKVTQENLLTANLQIAERKRLALVGFFASGLAHEINNPLSIALGNIARLRAEFDASNAPTLGGAIEPTLKKLESSFLRISKVVKSLREFSSESDPEELKRIFPLSQLIQTMKELSKGSIVKEGITFEIDEIPDVFLEAQFNQLMRALFNLIQNSIESVQKEDSKFIRIAFKIEGPYLLLLIVDSGPAIAKEIQSHIFDPFFSTKDVGKGQGMGLSSAQGIIKAQLGELDYLEGQKNTTFQIKLPIAKFI